MEDKLNQAGHRVVDILLIILAGFLLVLMGQQIWQVGTYIIFENPDTVEVIVPKILSFFLILEFFAMISRYLKEDHHIPIRYLIYICITAILRHEIGNHTTSKDTLLVSVAIFVLVVTLFIIKKASYYEEEESDKDFHI